ncbi:DUF2946 family protein [Halomonas sp. GD1P12]|uniref:DUF2946 family protein n=1 Tax=Halomonas sp. GD1P12 TaxID=2982691 RepID=UPI0021E3EBFB|nr:DUF2946 family protein [Halomonas sp. GD1P12]UYF99685.1 DUF2946 family protein [Halomonas sp. GD1P12]
MPLQRFTHRRWYRVALHAALTAMLLLLIGPLISQSQAGHHEAHRHAASGAHHDHPSSAHRSHAAPETSPEPSIEPIFTWFHECGYCSLWQQFPSAHAFLPAIARQAFVHHAPRPKSPHQGFASFDNYLHAPVRAPPLA